MALEKVRSTENNQNDANTCTCTVGWPYEPFVLEASWPGFLYWLKYLGFCFVCVCRPTGVCLQNTTQMIPYAFKTPLRYFDVKHWAVWAVQTPNMLGYLHRFDQRRSSLHAEYASCVGPPKTPGGPLALKDVFILVSFWIWQEAMKTWMIIYCNVALSPFLRKNLSNHVTWML